MRIKEKNYKNIYWFLSTIFHPVFVPVLLLLTCVPNVDPFHNLLIEKKILFFFLFFFLNTFLPCFFVFILYKKNLISDIELKNKRERILPLSFTFLCLIVIFFVTKQFFLFNSIITTIILGYLLITIASLLISLFWKVSLHMLCVGGALSAIGNNTISFHESYLMFYLFLFISLILGYSRLKQNAHNKKQVILGFLLGFVLMLFVFSY